MKAGQARHDFARSGLARHGPSTQARPCPRGMGRLWHGVERQAWNGAVWRGVVRRGEARLGFAWPGVARPGQDWHGRPNFDAS